MKINSVSFGAASAITMAILWVLCSFMVFVMPGSMMNITGTMVHANLSETTWTLTFGGFLTGLICWVLIAGIFGWALSFIYNLLTKK